MTPHAFEIQVYSRASIAPSRVRGPAAADGQNPALHLEAPKINLLSPKINLLSPKNKF